MSLSELELERYSRQIVLEDIGFKGQLRLKGARVALVGVGGLGSYIATQLAAIGVGYLRIVDRDIVALSNLHRQPIFDINLLGYAKVEAARKKLLELNPDICIDALPLSVDYRSAGELVRGVDVVVDGLDSIETRYAVNAACVRRGVPFIYGSAIGTVGAASTIIPGKTPCIRCIYPRARDEDLPKCGTEGVHPSVLSLVSSVEVSEAVKLILGQEASLAGRLLFCDLRDLAFDAVAVKKHDACPACSGRGGEEPSERRFIVDLCGRERGRRVLMITPKENLDLDLDRLAVLLAEDGYDVTVKGELGVTFTHDERTTVSVLKSGVAVITTLRPQEEAPKVYRGVVVDRLGVSPERLGLPEAEIQRSSE